MNLNLTHHDVNWVYNLPFEGAGILPQIELSRSKANPVPFHFKQEVKGEFPYLFQGMAR